MPASVLIVEKNRFVRHMLQEVLEETGYRVSAVATSSFARSLVASHGEKFDLALLHVRTSDGENVNLCSNLRAGGFDRPIVVLSENSAEREVSQAGASASIHTPFSIEILLRQVEASLKQYSRMPVPVLRRPS